jgi:hypothetical protein
MSTDYCLLRKVLACDLFDGRLEEFGVREHVQAERTTKHSRCLTDGHSYLWVHIDDDGSVDLHSYYPGEILHAVAEVFDTYIVSEHDPQYWGFDTQEEWDAYMEKRSKEADKKSHIELLKYLRGEPNDIVPGTIGMLEAEIAKTLVQKDRSLLLPINKDKLLNEVRSIYDREQRAALRGMGITTSGDRDD